MCHLTGHNWTGVSDVSGAEMWAAVACFRLYVKSVSFYSTWCFTSW